MAIPFTAIIKVCFDNIEKLKPLGFLIGEPKPNMVQSTANAGRGAEADVKQAANNALDAREQKRNMYDVDEPTPITSGKGSPL